LLNISPSKQFQKGFTLIEVMAAVAVFAISAAGLYSINQQTVLATDYLERKTFAHWVALNHYNTLSLGNNMVLPTFSDDKKTMSGIEWNISTKISETPVQSVRRVVIAVTDNSGKQLAEINGFIGPKTPNALLGLP